MPEKPKHPTPRERARARTIADIVQLGRQHLATHGAAALSLDLFALLGSGFCGGLTTYSTFAVEAVGLTRIRRPLTGIGYVVVSVVAGLAAAWGGYTLTA